MNETNADYFCGRTRETTALLSALANDSRRWPVLIGASGVGKSSVAQAGVLDLFLRQQGLDPTTPAGKAMPSSSVR